jgi:hypothetical protein
MEALDKFSASAPAASIVWESTPAEGAVVAQGDEILRLLDCEKRLVEVAISERHFEKISPGDIAWVQLKGSSQQVEGRVEAVRGQGGRLSRRGLAVEPPELGAGQLGVLVRLAPMIAPDEEIEASFCDVGRTARVRLGGDASFGELANRVRRSFARTFDSAASRLGDFLTKRLAS